MKWQRLFSEKKKIYINLLFAESTKRVGNIKADDSHEMTNLIFSKDNKKKSKCCLLQLQAE